MDDEELTRSARLEDRHWWYAARRALVRRLVTPLPAGRAVDVGCGPAGNTQVLADLGWRVTGLEYAEVGATLAARRGVEVVRGDARALPFADACADLVLSTDAWEHIDDDAAVAAETARVLRPGGLAMVAVPADMRLWSSHDVALGHVRRYTRPELAGRLGDAGLDVVELFSWNVLLRPVAALRRRTAGRQEAAPAEGVSEMEEVHPLLNTALRSVVALEQRLPVQTLPGISLVALARRPG